MATQTMQHTLEHPNNCNGDAGCTCEHGKYFVTAVDGGSFYLMAGPYATHQAAEAHRELALKIANGCDAKAWFMAWGITRMPDDCAKVGVLNRHGLI